MDNYLNQICQNNNMEKLEPNFNNINNDLNLEEEIIEEIEEIEEKEEGEKTGNNCSLKKHEEKEAKIYCVECNINMCNVCEKLHSELFTNHHIYNIKSNDNNIFTGYCQERKHNNKLEYYCHDHNMLCCAACLCKIRGIGNGKHNKCRVCYMPKIKEIKKNTLSDNMKYLDNLSKSLTDSINDLKKLYNVISDKKDKLKEEIQKIFTQIRNALNNREDQILEKVDKKFDELFFKEELIKESEKLPNKVKASLEKGKISEDDWNDKNKLSTIINECINIENNIKDINLINDKIKQSNEKKDLNIIFEQNEESLLNNIKDFGNIISSLVNKSNQIQQFNSNININNFNYQNNNMNMEMNMNNNKDQNMDNNMDQNMDNNN